MRTSSSVAGAHRTRQVNFCYFLLDYREISHIVTATKRFVMYWKQVFSTPEKVPAGLAISTLGKTGGDGSGKSIRHGEQKRIEIRLVLFRR